MQVAVTNLLFIIFLLLYIQLPGFLLVQAIKKEELSYSTENILNTFFFGLGILILEYILLSYFGLRVLFLLVSPVLSATFLYTSIKKKERKATKDRASWLNIQFTVILIIVVLLTCLTQRYAFMHIEDCSSIYLYQDITWHIGNVAALSRGFPFYDFRYAGLRFNYHYFNDLIFGICKYCFGMDAESLLLRCTPILTIYTFSLGTYAFFNRISQKALLGLAMLICSGATITYFVMNTDEMMSLLNYHMFSNINGVAVSLASLISVYLFYSDIYREKEAKFGVLLILSVLMFVTTGLKGPFAVVIMPAMVVTAVLIALYDKNYKRMIAVSSVVGLSFLATYIVIIKGVENISKQSNNNRATELSIMKTFSRTRIWEQFCNLLDYGDKGHTLLYCLCVALIGSTIAVGLYYLLFVGNTVMTLWELMKSRNKPSAELLVAIISGWTGLAAFWCVSHIGFSQVYFLFVAVLFIVGAGAHLMSTITRKEAGVLLTIVVVVNTMVWGYYYAMTLTDILNNDDEHYKAIKDDYITANIHELTRDELLGLEWLRNNTDKKSIIATDRIDLWSSEYPTSDTDCRCFYYSAFAERQMYIEGYSYSDISVDEVEDRLSNNKKIYSADQKAAINAAREANVDYVIVTKRFNDTRAEFGEPVYSNQGISIYDTSKEL